MGGNPPLGSSSLQVAPKRKRWPQWVREKFRRDREELDAREYELERQEQERQAEWERQKYDMEARQRELERQLQEQRAELEIARRGHTIREEPPPGL